jgi:hypothetical protein
MAGGLPDGPEHPTPVVDEKLPWLTNRAIDIQGAMHVLARRPRYADEPRLLLSRADLRGIYLYQPRLNHAIMRHSNLARSWMPGSRLARSELVDADLRQANLQGANLAHADLRSAHLQGAGLRRAILREADLRGADLTSAILDEADLTDAKVDDTTVWPADYPRPRHIDEGDAVTAAPSPGFQCTNRSIRMSLSLTRHLVSCSSKPSELLDPRALWRKPTGAVHRRDSPTGHRHGMSAAMVSHLVAKVTADGAPKWDLYVARHRPTDGRICRCE